MGDATFKQDVVSISLDRDFCLIVFTGSAQIWAGGQHRIRLGKIDRSEESIKVEGLNKRAYWCSSRRLLAVLVSVVLCFEPQEMQLTPGFPVNDDPNNALLYADVQ